MERWKGWCGKRVFVKLRKGREYSGEITDVDEEPNYIFITLLDKYGKSVRFEVSEIKVIQEEVKR